jgi:FkbM family methyltransferase
MNHTENRPPAPHPQQRLHELLHQMQQAGLAIDTVYDIGACRGDWSRDVQAGALPQARFVLFEANPAYGPCLAATGFLAFCGVALSNPGREAVDFYNGTNTGDSYYKETTRFYDGQGSIQLPCATLDELRRRHALPVPQLIKLDTQGSELDILAGAEGFIDQVDLVCIECPIVRYNAGAPGLQACLDYFRERRFVPVDIVEIHRSEATLLQVDLLFMRQEAKERILGPNHHVRPFA